MLAREFRIGAREALFERPAWELDNLVARWARDKRAEMETE